MEERISIGTKEAAKELGVTQATVSKWCREKKLEGVTHDAKGSPWQIPVVSIQKFKLRRKAKDG